MGVLVATGRQGRASAFTRTVSTGEPGTAPPTLLCSPSPQLLGQWIYIGGASRYEPHLAELKAVKHAAFSFSPGSHDDELNVTEIMRL